MGQKNSPAMTVQDLINALSTLDPDMGVCVRIRNTQGDTGHGAVYSSAKELETVDVVPFEADQNSEDKFSTYLKQTQESGDTVVVIQ